MREIFLIKSFAKYILPGSFVRPRMAYNLPNSPKLGDMR